MYLFEVMSPVEKESIVKLQIAKGFQYISDIENSIGEVKENYKTQFLEYMYNIKEKYGNTNVSTSILAHKSIRNAFIMTFNHIQNIESLV